MSGWVGAALGVGMFLLLGTPKAAFADGQAPRAGEADDNVSAARAHFTKGKELYLAGSYREAIAELAAARALDPKAKDLVYNLAIVHEKLGEIDEALRYARLYVEMDLDPAERTRAETYIKRLEGAKAELKPVVVAPPPKTQEHERGRFDAAVIVAGVVAVGAVGAGVGFGIKALADKPSSFVTGTNGSYQQLQNDVSTAHTEAVVADICFGAGAAAAITAVVLYFARERDPDGSSSTPAPSSTSSSSSSLATPTFTVRPMLGQTRGGLLLVGSF